MWIQGQALSLMTTIRLVEMVFACLRTKTDKHWSNYEVLNLEVDAAVGHTSVRPVKKGFPHLESLSPRHSIQFDRS